MVPTTSGFFEARLTYSQGSSSRLNKQGPASWVHWQGTLGGLPHVTTAFLRVWGRGAFCRSSTPGGAYQPLHPLPVVTRYHQRLDNDNDENNVTDSINDNDANDNDNEKNDSQNDDDDDTNVNNNYKGNVNDNDVNDDDNDNDEKGNDNEDDNDNDNDDVNGIMIIINDKNDSE